MPIQIIDVQNVPVDKLREIGSFLVRTFRETVTSRSNQIEGKRQRWLDNYNAIPAQKVRTTPFPGASNFMPQLIRMHTDILTARLIGILYGTRPFWRPTSFMEDLPQDSMNSLAAWMQYTTFNRMNMYPSVDAIIHNALKEGTVVAKNWWNESTRYSMKGDDGNGKAVEYSVSEKDCKIDLVAFEDFFPYPITAKRLEFVKARFQRLRFTKEDIVYRKNIKLWNPTNVDILLANPDGMGASNSQQKELVNSGIALTKDIGQPYSVVEAHFEYELMPGKLFPLVAVFNPFIEGAASILRMYYKPQKDLFLDAFTDFRILPKNDSFYGDSVPQILEMSQEEQAQIHNARRDGNLIANVPGWKKKRYADVASPSQEWYPGKVFEVDNMDDLVPLTMGVNYNSMVDEEQFLLSLAERYTGVSPAMQGAGAGVNGKRGSYASQGTMALISEGNRRIDVYLRRMRHPFNNLGKNIYTNYRDFGDLREWKDWGQHATNLTNLFEADSKLVGGKTFFELSASDAGANRETDRSAMLLMGNTMSAYYHELASTAQIVAQTPANSPFHELMLQILDGARDMANRLLFMFDIGGRDKMLPDMRKLFGGDQQPGAGPQPGPGSSLEPNLPQPQEAVSGADVQGLSERLTALTGSLNQGPPQ